MEIDSETMMEVDEVEVEIKDFPDEVTLEILKYLDFESMKTATLVCKKWSELIGSSPKTMKNFVLNLDEERVKKIENFKKFRSQRKHVNVFIHFEQQNDEMLYKSVEKFNFSQARRVSFHRYLSSIHLRQIRKVLAKMPLLEDASMMFNEVQVSLKNQIRPLILKNIKRIRLFPVASNTLKLFNPKKIVEVRFEESSVANDIGRLVEFLQKTTNLEILRVNKTTFNAIFEHERNFSFKLKNIDMLYHSIVVTADISANFNKFLQSQLSLKVLNLSGLEGLSSQTYKTILGQLKGLKKLTVDGTFLPINKEFYKSLTTNDNMKTLVLLNSFSCDEAAKGILGIFPELEDLDLNFSISTKINFIASHHLKLKNLKCTTIHRSIKNGLKFANLTSLKVLHNLAVDHWLSTVKSSPNIETLSVFWVDKQITDDVIDVLIQQPTLRHLILGGTERRMTAIHKRLKKNHGNLRSLELSAKDKPSVPAHKKVIIEFHDNLTNRNFNLEQNKLTNSTWKMVDSQPKQCNSINDIIKFKFETHGVSTTVVPDMILM